MLGCAHACANPLTAHYGTDARRRGRRDAAARDPVQCAGGRRLYAELARDAGLSRRRREALARRVTTLMQAAGLPTTLAACGVSRDILPVLAEEASEQWTARFNPRPATEADLRRLYEAAV